MPQAITAISAIAAVARKSLQPATAAVYSVRVDLCPPGLPVYSGAQLMSGTCRVDGSSRDRGRTGRSHLPTPHRQCRPMLRMFLAEPDHRDSVDQSSENVQYPLVIPVTPAHRSDAASDDGSGWKITNWQAQSGPRLKIYWKVSDRGYPGVAGSLLCQTGMAFNQGNP